MVAFQDFRPTAITMFGLTWCILDKFVDTLESICSLFSGATVFHTLAFYPPGVQKYGVDFFSNLDELVPYFSDLYIIETVTHATVPFDGAHTTLVVARVSLKISATIQARMGSERLPGKVLADVVGRPMLVHQIERISRSLLIDEVIVATTDGPTDDAIVQVAEEAGAAVFRGDEEDVLGRVVGALKAFDVALHVECFGDSPLMDPTILDVVIGFYLKHQDQYDLVATGMKTTFPPGLDVTVYPSSVLFDVDDLVVSPEDREYVGINIKRRPDDFRLFTVEAPQLKLPVS